MACCQSSGELSSLPTSVEDVGCYDRDFHAALDRACHRKLQLFCDTILHMSYGSRVTLSVQVRCGT